jgi:hypothetical protein
MEFSDAACQSLGRKNPKRDFPPLHFPAPLPAHQ